MVHVGPQKCCVVLDTLNPSSRRNDSGSCLISIASWPRRWVDTWGAKFTASNSRVEDCTSLDIQLMASAIKFTISSVSGLSKLARERFKYSNGRIKPSISDRSFKLPNLAIVCCSTTFNYINQPTNCSDVFSQSHDRRHEVLYPANDR